MKTGRGRRKDLKPAVNNLLQLYLLKQNTSKSWEDIVAFFHKCAGQQKDYKNVRSLIEGCKTKFLKLSKDDVHEFLNQPVDFDNLGDFCQKFSLSRVQLIEGTVPFVNSSLPNGLVIELELFRHKQGLAFKHLHSWISSMSGSSVSQNRLKKTIDKTMEQYKKHRNNSGKEGGADELNSFKENVFTLPLDMMMMQAPSAVAGPSSQSCASPHTPPSTLQPGDPADVGVLQEIKLTLARKQHEKAALRRSMDDLEETLETLQKENQALATAGKEKSSLINKQQMELETHQKEVQTMQDLHREHFNERRE